MVCPRTQTKGNCVSACIPTFNTLRTIKKSIIKTLVLSSIVIVGGLPVVELFLVVFRLGEELVDCLSDNPSAVED